MVFHDDNCWMHQTIGPSPERQLEQQREALRKEGARIEAAVIYGRNKIAKFKSKYGDDLALYGMLYTDRTKPGHYGFVHREGIQMKVSEVTPLFVKELLDKLSSIPDAERANWLTKFLTELDHI